MSLWTVQRLDTSQRPSTFGAGYYWQDIASRRRSEVHRNSAWEADDAAHAFKLAVLENQDERIQAASYRVLPYTGGVSFYIELNVDTEEHDAEAVVGA